MSSVSYFDDVAEDWDVIRQGFFSDDLRERVYARAELRPGALAADVGAGTGFLTEGLLARGLRVVAVDPSRGMLERLAGKFGERLEIREGDAEHLPLADGSLAYAFANMVLHHVDDPPAALAEAWRVLAPGGRLVISDLDRHTHEFLRTEQHDRWLGFDRAEVRRWLEGAGFEEVRVEGTCETCCSTSQRGETADITVFIASGRRPPEA